ncbi:MAG: Fe-S cluster assembly protein SufD [Actinomycetota bacterium]|nr:Fe-S cluster assembly protein SufD [Actinomycetota bacterium]
MAAAPPREDTAPGAEAAAGAVEASPGGGAAVASHLHPVGSFDLADHAVPKGREEVWRFTPLKRLKGLHDGTFLSGQSVEGGKGDVEIDAPAEVVVEMVGRDDERLGTVYTPNDRVSAQAWASFEQARVISVPADTELAQPVMVTVRGEGDGPEATFNHLFLDVGAHARATVVLHHVGHTVRSGNAEIRIGDGAHLTLVTLQDWDDDAVHVAHLHASVGRDATYRQAVISIGGNLVRISSSLDYAGPGGEAELLGLYFADAGQHLEHRLFVEHNAPRTRSNVDYKGALQGQGAHTVWIGDVLIRKVAEGIDTYESNRNLVLTDGCQADSVPNLEIETGEIVGAGHASTTGRFDDEQLFYLQSRGVPEDEARRLVVHGFFNAIIRKIAVPEIEDRLRTIVEAELKRNVGAAA